MGNVLILEHNNKEEKIRMYKAALDQIPKVSYNTAQKLFGHLHFISTQSAENLMTVENLASIWGPTLLFSEVSYIFFFNFIRILLENIFLMINILLLEYGVW